MKEFFRAIETNCLDAVTKAYEMGMRFGRRRGMRRHRN